MKIINEEKRYRELKERIRLMNIQRIGIEKINLIEDSKKKKKGINEVIRRNKITNKKFKTINMK